MGTLLVLALGVAPADAGPTRGPASAARQDAAAMCLDPDAIEINIDAEEMRRVGVSLREVVRATEDFFRRRRVFGLAEVRALRVKGEGPMGEDSKFYRLGDFATVTLRLPPARR